MAPPIFLWSFESTAPFEGDAPLPGIEPTHISPCSLSECEASPVYLEPGFRHLPGRFDEGLAFDGSLGFGAIAHHPRMLIDEGSFSFWFNLPATGIEVVQGLVSKDARGYADGGHLDFTVDNGRLIVRFQRHDGHTPEGTSTIRLGSGSVLEANRWHHVAFTFDDARRILYLDGVEVDRNEDGLLWGLGDHALGGESMPESPPEIVGNFEPIVVGARGSLTSTGTVDQRSHSAPAVLDELAIYDRALAPAEIAMLTRARWLNEDGRLHITVEFGLDEEESSLSIPSIYLQDVNGTLPVMDDATISASMQEHLGDVRSWTIQRTASEETLEIAFEPGLAGSRKEFTIELLECHFIDVEVHWKVPPGTLPAFEAHPLSLGDSDGRPCSAIEAILPVPGLNRWDLWVALAHCENDASSLVRLADIGAAIGDPNRRLG
ncbi:MAG: LamG domain-containing protein, partial [Bradymonadaceae bacterium]